MCLNQEVAQVIEFVHQRTPWAHLAELAPDLLDQLERGGVVGMDEHGEVEVGMGGVLLPEAAGEVLPAPMSS